MKKIFKAVVIAATLLTTFNAVAKTEKMVCDENECSVVDEKGKPVKGKEVLCETFGTYDTCRIVTLAEYSKIMGTHPKVVACTTDADCCEKNPTLCDGSAY